MRSCRAVSRPHSAGAASIGCESFSLDCSMVGAHLSSITWGSRRVRHIGRIPAPRSGMLSFPVTRASGRARCERSERSASSRSCPSCGQSSAPRTRQFASPPPGLRPSSAIRRRCRCSGIWLRLAAPWHQRRARWRCAGWTQQPLLLGCRHSQTVREGIRAALSGAAALGDPAVVPWLLDCTEAPETARPAGAVLSMITGLESHGRESHNQRTRELPIGSHG